MFNNLSYMHRYMMGQLRRIYFMALPESKQDLKSSRIYYTTADSAAQTIAQLAGGTFLATLMSHSGISDANIGIITSLVSFAALTQLFLINYFKKMKKYKFLVTVTALQRILFAGLYFVPLLLVKDATKAFLIVIMYFLGQVFVQIGTPASQDWIASLVPSRLRGKYFSIKDSVAVFVVSSLMLICGMILDYFKKGNIFTGFIIIGIIIFILTVINVVGLSLMKEPKLSYVNDDGKEMHGRLAKRAKEQEVVEKGQSILSEIKEAIGDRKFRKAFTIQCLFTLAFYICAPFNSSYMINDLALPYTFIMLVSFIFNLYRIYIMPRLGRMADKHGMGKLLRFALFALGLNFLSVAFMMPFNAYPMYILSTFFGSTAWAFVGIGLFGLQLDFFRSDKRMIWLTLTSSVSGLFGFLVSVLGGSILDKLQKLDINLLGQKIYAQQILNLMGFLVILCAVIFIRLRIETEKIDTNRADGRVKI
ncbi:MAG: major facilitator superfamily 1 [Firmicutes bacterium]|nr:major facilitator superfamily 1 [Bacillota bacterium]